MTENPLVSIITPCYNAAKFLTETIESVLTQTYENWEMLIVDDASMDNSLKIISQYIEKDSRIKLIKNKSNLGSSESRNKAIKVAKGDYIAFLDSDDIWLSQKLKKQISFMVNKNVYMCYSAYETIDENGEIRGGFRVPANVTYTDMLKTSTMGTLTTIYNAHILGKHYFKNLGHEDYILKLEILKKIPFAQGVNEILAQYRIVESSLSSNKLKTALWQWKIYRNIEKLSIAKSAYYFTHYIYHGLTKYKKV